VMKHLSEKEYVSALEKMKRSPRDRVGILGELGVTGLSAAAGAAVSGAVAGAAGAATIAGSTTLASILGGVLVTTTPVGWVIGCVAAGAGLGYAASKLVRSGAKTDVYKIYSVRELEERIRTIRAQAAGSTSFEEKFRRVITSVQHLVASGKLSQEKSTEIIVAIQQHRIDADEAFDILESLIREQVYGRA
jgi:hypothetical protein